MRAVVQRVKEASVTVDDEIIGSIGNGLMVLIGCGDGDTDADMHYIVSKVLGLRVFPDAEAKMNLSVEDAGGELLLVSQFTLYGDVRKGRRPAFTNALHPSLAAPMFEDLVRAFASTGIRVQTGRFGADMDVRLLNQGPVTILLDSRKTF
jgi:D-tyrosyl-tRNA(Tyr) deacylase